MNTDFWYMKTKNLRNVANYFSIWIVSTKIARMKATF